MAAEELVPDILAIVAARLKEQVKFDPKQRITMEQKIVPLGNELVIYWQ